jgi:dephospho-CoA kinase
MSILVAVVGMPGAGKSSIADALVAKGYHYVRFGQIVIDEMRRREWPMGEEHERKMREGLRQEHGMAAMAILNLPKFDGLLEKGNVVGDGLYSWSEYKILKERYGDRLIIVAVHAAPKIRHDRLAARTLEAHDTAHRYRPITHEQARTRDHSEIENLEKGGPVAMADYHIVNEGTIDEFEEKIKKFLAWLESK